MVSSDSNKVVEFLVPSEIQRLLLSLFTSYQLVVD